jgi:hypothetical protein
VHDPVFSIGYPATVLGFLWAALGFRDHIRVRRAFIATALCVFTALLAVWVCPLYLPLALGTLLLWIFTYRGRAPVTQGETVLFRLTVAASVPSVLIMVRMFAR